MRNGSAARVPPNLRRALAKRSYNEQQVHQLPTKLSIQDSEPHNPLPTMNKVMSKQLSAPRSPPKCPRSASDKPGEIALLKDLPENERLTVTVKRCKGRLEWVATPINSWRNNSVTLSTREARKHIPKAMARYITALKTTNSDLYRKLVSKNSALAKLAQATPEIIRDGWEAQLTRPRAYQGFHWMDCPVRLEPINLSANRRGPEEFYFF